MTLLSLIQLCFSLSVNGFLKFKCDICNRKFEKRTRMIRHIKNMHSMDIHRVDLSKFVLPKKFQQLHPWSLIELWQMAWTPKETNPGGVYRGVRSHPFYRRLSAPLPQRTTFLKNNSYFPSSYYFGKLMSHYDIYI